MATKYVAPAGSGGNDGNAGDIGTPWLTWDYAFNQLSAGDTLYVRGGTYTDFKGLYSGSYYGVRVSSKSGTSDNWIRVYNYPDEVPTLDCTTLPDGGSKYGVALDTCNYWYIKGLIVTSVHDSVANDSAAWGFLDCTNFYIERCDATDSGNGLGYGGQCDDMYFLNCDAYELYDVYDSGGLANGFSTNIGPGSHHTFEGCRAWLCSDDGWDCFSNWQGSGYITYINCWAFENGDYGGYTGNGAGFKWGMSFDSAETGVQRLLQNCISFDNTGYGYDESQDPGEDAESIKAELYNCVSFNNSTGYNMGYGAGHDTSQAVDIVRNCISYSETLGTFHANNTVDHCSWQDGLSVSDADFVSVTSTEAKGARQANGDLPVLTFLHLAAGSDLIAAGVAVVGLVLDGDKQNWDDPPSLGAYEYDAPPILVVGIVVTAAGGATTIVVDGGTLQMTATVYPTDATNKNVTWSITNLTGTATISATGLVTASSDGVIRVVATAQDGTGVYGIYHITISNQGGAAPVSVADMITGNVPTYRFYISTEPSSLSTEVFPLNFNSTALVDQQENGKIFYRRKFTGSLLFGTNSTAIDDSGVTVNRYTDWTFFWNIEQTNPCLPLYMTIMKYVSGDSFVYWEGMFSTTDGEFDIDRCAFEVVPLPNDDYNEILDNVDIQYNILPDEEDKVTTTAIHGDWNETYTRNRWLCKIGSDSVLDFLAEKIKTGVTVSSEFFTDTPNNYVTESPNHLLHLTIAQKSDIIRFESTNQAAIALLSWNELMDILWAMFQVTWDYDATTDTINVEHISWWTSVAGLDLRTQLACEATNKYKYIKESMPKYEKFSMMEAEEINFIGTPIWYDSACVDQNPETNIRQTTIPVTTDLEYIINYRFIDADNESLISDEGFVILCNYFDDPDYFVELQPGSMDGSIHLNMHLSWANLHHHYFRHNRVLISGNMNNDPVTFVSAQKTKEQKCSAILCATHTYDPDNTITTELGEIYFDSAKAKVKTSSLSPMGNIDFTLLYGPASNEQVAIPDVKYIDVTETVSGTTSTFTALASQATASDVDLIIYLTCVDAGGDTCDTAPITITILNGQVTGNNSIAWCEDSICVGVPHPDSSDAVTKGWVVSWLYSNDSKCIT